MPKFSTNGKVLGRPTQGSLDRSNKQWSQEEDQFLAIAVEAGMTVNDVASRLQRGRVSIMQRKWVLGVPGRFKKSSRKKKTILDVLKPQPKTQTSSNSIELFKLESNVSIPTRGATTKNQEARIKIRSLFSQMKPGQSFVVPKELIHPVYHLARTEFEAYKISRSKTTQDGKFFRIFRVV
jgi:hypothetical protein